jgi:hypothetical protein
MTQLADLLSPNFANHAPVHRRNHKIAANRARKGVNKRRREIAAERPLANAPRL